MRYLTAASAVAFAAHPAMVGAQTIDYQALQAVVGEPVTTSVTGKPQRASELPASTLIITADQIARSPARDVPGILKSYAGIDVNRWTAGQSDVAVRGGVQTYNARLLVLVDGRQVYLDHYGMTDWNLLGVSNQDIQQIELVRGPASALFGFNAASGVVNIVTRKPGSTGALKATLSAGNHGVSQMTASLFLPITDFVDAKLTGGRLREDERDIPPGIVGRPQYPVEADHVSGEFHFQADRTSATFGGGYASNRQLEFLPSQLLSNQLYRNADVHATVRQDTAWGGVSLDGFINWLDARYGTDGSIGGLTRSLELANRIMVGKVSALYRLGRANTLRVGMEYRSNRLTSDAQYSDVISYEVASANVMIDLKPTDRITTTGAIRIDRLWLDQSGVIALPAVNDPAEYDRFFDRISLNAAILLQAGSDGRFRINVGRGYQLPSLTNYGFRLSVPLPPPYSIVVAGSPTIAPVATWSGELGYTRQLRGFRVDATAFYTRTTGTIAPPVLASPERTTLIFTSKPTIVQRYYAAGDYTTYGTELSVAGHVSFLTWRANYTWTHTRESLDDQGSPAPIPLSPSLTTPRHKANIVLEYDPGGQWNFSTVTRYTAATRQFATAPAVPLGQVALFDVDSAVALDARVGFRPSRAWEVFASGENLTVAGGASLSPLPADRRVRIGLRLGL
ncbi:TonB-dependent receptor plug domain-containing protein [Sphingomonas mollis]|nr:TonB-dependent receptor [Sphingomonas sp. BT553]